MQVFQKAARLMGSAFVFKLVADNAEKAENLLQLSMVEVQRLEALLSEFRPDSATTRLNQAAAGHWVTVEPEVFDLLVRCQHLFQITQGAFDISGVALRRLYNFKGDEFRFPADSQVQEVLKSVGFQWVELQAPDRVRLTRKGMHLAFGAIGKGYAADCVKRKMKALGVFSGAINASGDLCVWGTLPDGSPWKAGIVNPDRKEEILLWLPLSENAIATSGDYEQYFDYQGRRYSHTLDPKSGRPVTGVKSVSVISPKAELSDALATAVTVLGIDLGIDLINQIPETHCLFIDDQNRMHTSRSLLLPPELTHA